VLLLSAVTGQTGPVVLAQAGLHALALVDAMTPFIGSARVLPQGHVVAQVSEAGADIGARTASSASMLTWPGVTATRVFVPAHRVPKQARRGATVGHVVVIMGTQKVEVPVTLDEDLPPPTLLQRLT
jgi:serine-type D-Ala-D-Ala carboxypeptidase (penicillin-binding protein 5/6)